MTADKYVTVAAELRRVDETVGTEGHALKLWNAVLLGSSTSIINMYMFIPSLPFLQWQCSLPLGNSFQVPLCSVTTPETVKGRSVTMFAESLPFLL